jgi:hypothetical protein
MKIKTNLSVLTSFTTTINIKNNKEKLKSRKKNLIGSMWPSFKMMHLKATNNAGKNFLMMFC